MPIDFDGLSLDLRARVFAAQLQRDRIILRPGTKAVGILRVAANVADTETVAIGPDTYEFETVATATGQTTGAGGMLNNTTNPLLLPITLATLGVALGDPIAVENEIMKVHRDAGAAGVVLLRGRYGTTVAAHGNAIAINKGNGITAGRIPVGLIATFTPAVATPALAAEINNAAVGNVERATAKASTIFGILKATSFQAGAEMLLEAVTAGVLTTALAETLAGANNVWAAAAMAGGSAPAVKKQGIQARVPTATEVALGTMRFMFDFTPSAAVVSVVVTATGIITAWNGGFTITAGMVTLDNAGATDWAATDTVRVLAYE